MTKVWNLDVNLEGYLKLYFTMLELGNLDVKLGFSLFIFIMVEAGNFKKIEYTGGYYL
jgi:hypothetical protein